jgi:hypothetical protein
MQPLAILRKKIWRTIIILVVTVQIINVSIDATDPSHFEDLTINEIESWLEFVVEIALGHENAIRETDEHDHHTTHKPGSGVNLFSSCYSSITPEKTFEIILIRSDIVPQHNFKSRHRAIVSPPPKFS